MALKYHKIHDINETKRNYSAFQKYLHRGKHQCHHCSLFFQTKEMLDLHITNSHVTNVDGQDDLNHPKSIKKINNLFTYGDLFYDLHDKGRGSKPSESIYKQNAREWIQKHVSILFPIVPTLKEVLPKRTKYLFLLEIHRNGHSFPS